MQVGEQYHEEISHQRQFQRFEIVHSTVTLKRVDIYRPNRSNVLSGVSDSHRESHTRHRHASNSMPANNSYLSALIPAGYKRPPPFWYKPSIHPYYYYCYYCGDCIHCSEIGSINSHLFFLFCFKGMFRCNHCILHFLSEKAIYKVWSFHYIQK